MIARAWGAFLLAFGALLLAFLCLVWALMAVVLLVRPAGLFGSREAA